MSANRIAYGANPKNNPADLMPVPPTVMMFSVRLPVEIVFALRKLAYDNRRPIGTQTLIVLEEGLKVLKGDGGVDE